MQPAPAHGGAGGGAAGSCPYLFVPTAQAETRAVFYGPLQEGDKVPGSC